MPSEIIITAKAQLEVAVKACEEAAVFPSKQNLAAAKNFSHEFVRCFGRRTLETLTNLQKEIK